MGAVAPPLSIHRILDFDPDLGAGLPPDALELARSACMGEVLRVPVGVWRVPDWAGERDDLFGLVLVEGLVCREVALRDRRMLELLGPGDVVQLPVRAGRPRLGGRVRLTAVIDSALLTLGVSFVRAAARWPCLLAAVHARLEAQRESLAIQGLIAHLPRAEHRVLLMLWHLADRWGRVTPDGTVLPLGLTHDVLGQLVGARRSTTTLALTALEAEGSLTRLNGGGWLVTATGARRVAVIARTDRSSTRVLGETFRLRQRVGEVRQESQALRAEARQARARRRSAGSRPAG